MSREPLFSSDDQIDWVLAHPAMSDWLKRALESARDRDPIDVLNDLEMLNTLLSRWAQAEIDLRSMPRFALRPDQ